MSTLPATFYHFCIALHICACFGYLHAYHIITLFKHPLPLSKSPHILPLLSSLPFLHRMRPDEQILRRINSSCRIRPDEQILQRINSSCRNSSSKILPSNSTDSFSSNSLVKKHPTTQNQTSLSQPPIKSKPVGALFRSFLSVVSLQALLQTCRWLTTTSGRLGSSSTLGRTVTGTLFGSKKGHVSFAVQENPRSDPSFVIELATSTGNLVKEMSSGLVRIALECKTGPSSTRHMKLFQEPAWTMYCNGTKCGYAMARACGEDDWDLLSTIQAVSIGAGVLPVDRKGSKNGSLEGSEVMYMRGRFERVVGSRDSEAFYMLNPDGIGGPELSIFLLRI